MQKPLLVFLTANFPYLPGEAFIESEIDYLTGVFKKVDIIPTSLAYSTHWVDVKRCRDLPSNATIRQDIVSDIQTRTRFPNVILNFVKMIANPELGVLIRQEISRAKPFGRKGLKKIWQYLLRAMIVRDVLSKYYGPEQEEPIVFYSYWLMESALGLGLLEKKTAISVSRAHRYDLYEYSSVPPYRPYQPETVKRLDRIVLISQDGYEYLSARYPQSKMKMLLFRLGVADGKMSCRSSEDGILRIVSCSTLRPVKRVQLILNAVQACDFPLEWTHFGEGPLMDQLQEASAKLPEHIHANFPGYIQNKDLLKLYESKPIDLFINVSSSEGLPVSIMEAMSYGIPVIATDVGGTKELVSDQTGYLLGENPSSEEIASAIKSFRNLPPEVQYKKRSCSYGTWSAMVNADHQYIEFTKYLIGALNSNLEKNSL